MFGSSARKPSQPSINENAGPSAITGAGKEDMKNKEGGTSDVVSGEAEAQTSHEGDEEEEVEDPPRKGTKRAASEDLEAEASKRDKITLFDDSESDAEVIPKHRRRTKPQADS